MQRSQYPVETFPRRSGAYSLKTTAGSVNASCQPKGRTDNNDVVIELTLVLSLVLELGHLLEARKHSVYNAIIRGVDHLPDPERICANELRLYASHICGEELDKGSYAIALLARELSIFDRLDELSLYPQLT